FLAVPVSSWGRIYYAATLQSYPSIQIISNSENNGVIIAPRFRGDPRPVLNYGNANYGSAGNLSIILDKWSAFDVSECSGESAGQASMTGTLIVGQKAIGVISGNCRTITQTSDCKSGAQQLGKTSDIVVEMLLPVESFGTEFIIVHVERKEKGLVMIVAAEPKTHVNISQNYTVKTVHYENAGDWTMDLVMDANRMLVSNKRIQVLMVMRSACYESNGFVEEQGDPGMSLVIPNTLFYVKYAWRVPKTRFNHYVIIVALKDHIENIELNTRPLPSSFKRHDVLGSSKFQVVTILSIEKKHNVTSKDDQPFGCYLMGMAPKRQYLRPAGFR
ncbi:unnamed protein product, partial [Lymnaea stagnalis]